ncbi:hypothetical protein HISP_07315 [Haloarcula hispanica N601]|uniref:Cox cluster protein n=2 Tax=Haloarcula hispanica TaxID=51589 RepID=V5TKG6_HALHI|nr:MULTISPECIES: hypothetical protein [Haloarcula]AEM57042.1 conserved hypothetical protein [Haloarcula hispanica ATCC 33960]AHB65831.1 hypothetical protein HISP_07315 [Haloarcula hispanica N601]MUV48793.1 hypothetical protein [Haloarcula sp. CBA1122]
MQQHTTVIDKAAMALSGGLMLLGVVVLGIVEILAGKPYSAAPLTNDAGEIIATPMIDPTLRTGLVLAGLLVLALYALYRLVAPMKNQTATAQQEITAD